MLTLLLCIFNPLTIFQNVREHNIYVHPSPLLFRRREPLVEDPGFSTMTMVSSLSVQGYKAYWHSQWNKTYTFELVEWREIFHIQDYSSAGGYLCTYAG